MTPLIIISIYLCLLLALGLVSNRFFRGTTQDYFVASRSIGPFLLLMSVFGTTMTAFALVGSTGEAYRNGIGTYGKLASWSGLVHSAVFFFIGIKLWSIGKRQGYVTQCQFFRERFESPAVGYVLFPVLVALVVPYLLIGILGAGGVVQSITRDPEVAWLANGVPRWIGGLVICVVVLIYIFFGGLRGAAWANTFQTIVFMVMGVATFLIIANKLGGPAAASRQVLEFNGGEHAAKMARDHMPQIQFITFALIPLSVGMFPHVFQHWLTAKSAESFKLTVVAHPLFIMIVWVPCVLLGVWATAAVMPNGLDGAGELVVQPGGRPNAELAVMVARLTPPLLGGLLSAGILAAIMSSLDSQFLCLGTMFTNDIALRLLGPHRLNEKQQVLLARGFIVGVVAVTYALSLLEPMQVFKLGVWVFSGFAGLFPIVCAALYWRGATKAGVLAAIAATIGSLAAFYLLARGPQNPYGLVYDIMPVAFITTASIAALVVVSLITRPPSQATMDRFFPRPEAGTIQP